MTGHVRRQGMHAHGNRVGVTGVALWNVADRDLPAGRIGVTRIGHQAGPGGAGDHGNFYRASNESISCARIPGHRVFSSLSCR